MNIRLSLVGSGASGSHVFGAEGGTFGRSQKCDWVLADPDRVLSSVHGRIVSSNGEFIVIDESTNGLFVSGLAEPLGRGNSVVLGNGTRFSAGRYTMEAQIVAAQRPRPSQHAAYSPPAGAGRPDAEKALRDTSEFGSVWGQNSQDPLRYLDGAQDPTFGAPSVNSGVAGSYGAQRRPLASHGLPLPGHSDDVAYQALPEAAPQAADRNRYDPLRALAVEPQPPSALAENPVLAPTLPLPSRQLGGPAAPATAAGAVMIPEDFLSRFGPVKRNNAASPPTSGVSPQYSPPAPSPPRIQPPAAPPAAAARIPDEFDPLTAFVNASLEPNLASNRPQATPRVDGLSPPPGSQPAPQNDGRGAAQAKPRPLSPSLMADIVELGGPKEPSGETDRADGKFDTLEAMKARREQRKAALLEKTKPGIDMPLPIPQSTAVQRTTPQPQPSKRDTPVAGQVTGGGGAQAGAAGAALDVLFEGMGFPQPDLPADHEGLLHEIGGLVREMAAGLVLLLSARKLVKSEFRMDETQIQPKENNPFKFFQVAELALDELFLTRSGGYQLPADAARSAFKDIEQHTLLTMSAMQRAIRLLFERLAPDAMGETGDEGGLRIRGLGARKGKWETYVETHTKMSREVDSISRQIISEAFAQVQEEQVRRSAKEHWGQKK